MSIQNMEITIPSEKSEIELLTAGKYCAKDITVKSPLGFKVVTGTFTLDDDLTGGSPEIPAEQRTNNKLVITGLPANTIILEVRSNKRIPERNVAESNTKMINSESYMDGLIISTAVKTFGKRNMDVLCDAFCECIIKVPTDDGVALAYRGSASTIGTGTSATVNEAEGTLTITYTIKPDDVVPDHYKGYTLIQKYYILSRDIIGYEPADTNNDGDTSDLHPEDLNKYHEQVFLEPEATSGAPIRGEQITYTWTAYCWNGN